MATMKRPIKKAQNGYTKPTKDSTAYYKGVENKYKKLIKSNEEGFGKDSKVDLSPEHKAQIYNSYKKTYKQFADTAVANQQRQGNKGKPGYDKNGYRLKMKNGGSLSGLKASTKRVGPVDPKGAYTKVQEKTLKGAKGKASLTKDKQLGATKMAKRGMSVKKK